MIAPLSTLADEELEVLAAAFDADGDAARAELERRARAELADWIVYDEPGHFHADRAADAWERGRDRVAERAR